MIVVLFFFFFFPFVVCLFVLIVCVLVCFLLFLALLVILSLFLLLLLFNIWIGYVDILYTIHNLKKEEREREGGEIKKKNMFLKNEKNRDHSFFQGFFLFTDDFLSQFIVFSVMMGKLTFLYTKVHFSKTAKNTYIILLLLLLLLSPTK